jgi:hypothetical protein
LKNNGYGPSIREEAFVISAFELYVSSTSPSRRLAARSIIKRAMRCQTPALRSFGVAAPSDVCCPSGGPGRDGQGCVQRYEVTFAPLASGWSRIGKVTQPKGRASAREEEESSICLFPTVTRRGKHVRYLSVSRPRRSGLRVPWPQLVGSQIYQTAARLPGWEWDISAGLWYVLQQYCMDVNHDHKVNTESISCHTSEC